MKKIFGDPQKLNQLLIEKIKNTKINLEYIKKKKILEILFLKQLTIMTKF